MNYLLHLLAAAMLLTVAIPTHARADTGAGARPYVRSLSDRCSAVVIAPGFALTADHCVTGGATALRPGGTVPVVLARGDDRLDYALIVFPQAELPCPCAPLAASEAALDEPIYVIGYPRGIAQVVTIGASQGVHANENLPYGRRLVTTAQVAGGNSGGGAFVLRNGQYQLAGLLVEALGHLSFAVPLADLRPFLVRSLPQVQGI